MLVADFPSDGADAVVALAIDAARQALEGKEEGEPSMCCYQAIVAANGAMADGTWRGGGGGGGAGGARSNGTSAEEEQEQPEAKAAADEAATAATIRRLTAEAQLSVANLTAASLLGVPTSDASSSGASNTAAKLEDGAAKSLRGPWSYRVGLVGKPSAGKSSLFNALTRAGFARVVGSGGSKRRQWRQQCRWWWW